MSRLIKNKIFPKILIAILIIINLQSCAISYYKVRDEMPNQESKSFQGCNIKYNITIKNNPKNSSFNIEKIKAAAQKVFISKNCNAQYVNDESESNFNIEVIELSSPGTGAGYLALMTFYLVPAWETIEDSTFTYFDKTKKVKHTYYLDSKTYLHWVFLPFFWINFINADSDRSMALTKTLSNFLNNI